MSLQSFLSSRYDSEAFERFLSERFFGLEFYDTVPIDDYLNETEKKSIDSYRFLGKSELDDGKEIGFFEFKSTTPHIENKRAGYNVILKKLAYDELLDGAIAAFYHPESDAWRLSFVGFEYDEGRAKVTNLKRYTYVLGEGIPTKTPLAQLKNLKYPNLNEIEEAFSVEAVTDEFYKSYKALLENINEELEPQKALFTGKEDPEVEIRKFSRKLLGRITFMYFLQKKGWLGVKQEWGDGDRNFLQKTLESCKGNFYDERLIPLFFTALNSMRDDDYFELLDCKIPFLNGGLFTKESYDKEEITLSNELFEKIFDTFNQYNFTIIEDLPHDSEVAIDPEMLGRVFENLIEENYRKGKGAFYTPREIVHYMCKQSIIMYLSNHFEKEHIEKLVNNDVTDDNYIKKHATDIKVRLLQMKVLDPAIGSGAFPMGILHEMVQIIGNLNKAENTSKEKKLIIENSIYGVDIDGSAVDIAKLRFWLSIIVDEEEPFPLPNLAFKIMQGNSLIETIDGFSPVPEDIYEQKESKPISLFEEAEQSLFDESKFELLKQNIHAFYNASNTTKKKNLEQKIKAQIQEIVCGYIDKKEDTLKDRVKYFDNGETSISTKEKVLKEMGEIQSTITKARKVIGDILTNNFQTTELFLYKLWFGEVIQNGGFDIVIGNPPYVGEKGNKEVFRLLQSEFKDRYQKNSDLFYFFFMKSIDLLKKNGVLGFITTNYYLTADGASRLRKEFKEKTAMLNIINFNEMKIFKSALGQHNIITILKKTTKNENTNIINVLEPKEKFSDIFESCKEVEAFQIDSKKIYGGQNNYMRVSQYGFTLDGIFEKMTTNFKKIDEICFINTGFNSGADRVTKSNLIKVNQLLDDVNINDGIFVLTEKEYLDIKPEDELVYKCYKSSDIKKFCSNDWQKLYVIWTTKDTDINKFPKVKNHLEKFRPFLELKREYKTGQLPWFSQHWAREYDLFANKNKIVLPYRAKKNIFAYSDKEYFGSKDILYLRQRDKSFNMKYILALLNSKLYYTWLYYRGKRKGETLELYVTPISEIPIKNLSEDDQKIFIVLSDYIIWLKANNANIDNYVDNAHIAKLFEDVIDAMVLELYLKRRYERQVLLLSTMRLSFLILLRIFRT